MISASSLTIGNIQPAYYHRCSAVIFSNYFTSATFLVLNNFTCLEEKNHFSGHFPDLAEGQVHHT